MTVVKVGISSRELSADWKTLEGTFPIEKNIIVDRDDTVLQLDQDELVKNILNKKDLKKYKDGDLEVKNSSLDYTRVTALAMHYLGAEIFLRLEGLWEPERHPRSCIEITYKDYDLMSALFSPGSENGAREVLGIIRKSITKGSSDPDQERSLEAVRDCNVTINIDLVVGMLEQFTAYLKKMEKDDTDEGVQNYFSTQMIQKEYEKDINLSLPGIRINRNDERFEWHLARDFGNSIIEIRGLFAKWQFIESVVKMVDGVREGHKLMTKLREMKRKQQSN